MGIIDLINENLNLNNNLTAEVKNDLFELTLIFNKAFPNIDLSNLNNRLKTLKIESKSKFVEKNEISSYSPVTNTLSLNIDRLKEDNDVKHIMMFELLKMITAKDNDYGFDKDKKLVALNAGYTEILANMLVGNESDNMYHEDEVIATNLIARMIGDEIFLRSYFTNDYNLMDKNLRNAGLH